MAQPGQLLFLLGRNGHDGSADASLILGTTVRLTPP